MEKGTTNKWKVISVILAMALIISMVRSYWIQYETRQTFLYELYLNLSRYQEYATRAMEEFEKTKDQQKLSEDMDFLYWNNITPMYHSFIGNQWDKTAPEVNYYAQSIVDPLFWSMPDIIESTKKGEITRSQLELLRQHDAAWKNFRSITRWNGEPSISEMKEALDQLKEDMKRE